MPHSTAPNTVPGINTVGWPTVENPHGALDLPANVPGRPAASEGVLSVLDARIGAVADGITDNAAAYVRAKNLLTRGGTLFFPPGTYRSSASMIFDVPVEVVGAGPGVVVNNNMPTRLNFDAGVTGIIFNGQAQGAAVRNISLVSSSTVAGTDDGIRVHAHAVLIDHVLVNGFGQDGIIFDSRSAGSNCNGGKVSMTRCAGNKRHGFHTIGGDSNTITLDTCDATGNIVTGFEMAAGGHNLVLHAHASSNGFAFRDYGNNNLWLFPYSEGAAPLIIMAGSSWGTFIDGGSFGSPPIDFSANTNAQASWTVIQGGGFRRTLKITDPATTGAYSVTYGAGAAGAGTVDAVRSDGKILYTLTNEVDPRLQFGTTLELKDGKNVNIGGGAGSRIGHSEVSKLSFYGAAPIVRPSLTYSRTGEGAAAAQLRGVLASLGLVADNTTA